MILDPSRPWLIQYLLVRGFDTVPTWEELDSDEFALTVLIKLRRDSWLWEEWFCEALQARDRMKLIPHFKRLAIDGRLNRDHFKRLLAVGKSVVIRESLKKLGRRFSFHRGPKPKLPVWRYSEAYEVAEVLRPTIQSYLELTRKTSRTPTETLQFMRKDHPVACTFLLERIEIFERALADPSLLRRAKTRIPARARVLADAMAGTDYKLSFSTSRERVGEVRRTSGKTSH
jgi:hypothetical protein